MSYRRIIGVPTATGVGLAAMLGAGVFAVWAPAAAHAGAGILAALGIALLIATLNATSTTRLARAYPESGGVFAFGRALGAPRLAFAAGALFLVGKLASAAAIARVAADYLAPDAAGPLGTGPLAAGIILALAAVNASGVRSTAVASTITAGIVVALLLAADLVGVTRISDPHPLDWPDAPAGLLPAATLIFFAFAGYARVATLGGEVRDPRRTLPVAVAVSLVSVAVLAGATAVILLLGLGTAGLAASSAPLADLAGPGWRPVVVIAVVVACVGSALGVLAGLSRTAQAMAQAGELPRALAPIHPRTGTPIRADAVVAVVAATAALLLPSAVLIGASAGAVLGYYAISHTLAWRLGGAAGRAIAAVGAVACIGLALWAPPAALLVAASVLVAGFAVRAVVAARRAA
ncbi:APC family permease [Homoserinibacter sp. GY 40078]|uniref:APC family permease n=1 Tax=Homoserinibacter sp. GY 40078 TaxID=2603275 RepID=UPI0011CAE7D3|nr:APC family permease [Homoserinibacter sp. GY 40078]TXK19519.1 APC family permease [Homoserinibacter sp. GY 40078]